MQCGIKEAEMKLVNIHMMNLQVLRGGSGRVCIYVGG